MSFHAPPMNDPQPPDYYETLQISSRANQDTLQRVFRDLAKRFHPDNGESGDAARFREVMDAFQVLSDPEQRARYDAHKEGLFNASGKDIEELQD